MDLVIRATVVFFFIFLVTRIAGRRELSALEPFDVILLVVLGDLVQQGITQSDQSVTGTLTVISTITLALGRRQLGVLPLAAACAWSPRASRSSSSRTGQSSNATSAANA